MIQIELKVDDSKVFKIESKSRNVEFLEKPTDYLWVRMFIRESNWTSNRNCMVFDIAQFDTDFWWTSMKSVLMQCKRILRGCCCCSYLPSTFPFLRMVVNELSPFSCLMVMHTSNRKSRAISSLIRCSLMRDSNTVGGTDPLTAKQIETDMEIKKQFKQTANYNLTERISSSWAWDCKVIF